MSDEYELHVESEEELFDILARNGFIPFDAQCVLTDDKTMFGSLGTGELIGRWAMYKGQPIKNIDIDDQTYEIDYAGMVGCIIGDNYGRVVIDMDDIFLGWLNPEEFITVHVHDGSDLLH